MRVCIFSYYFPPHFSGAGFSAVTLARQLRARGIDVFFITVDASGLPRDGVHDGFRLYRIGEGRGRHRELAMWWQLARTLAAHRQEFDILHGRGSSYRHSAIGPIARALGKKSLAVVSLAQDDLAMLGRGAAGRLQQAFLGCVDRYVALSHEIQDEMALLPLDGSRVVHIPQPVDTERFTPATAAERAALRARHGLPAGLLAIYAGVVDARKNVEWLVRQWMTHADVHGAAALAVIGPASRHRAEAGLRDRLRQEVAAAGFGERILFRDFTSAIEDLYRACDVFVLPSSREGMPNAVLEAMACGLPCLVTRVSGTRELVTHGKSGMLFDVGDESSFLEGLRLFLQSSRARTEVGEQARARMLEEYSAPRIAERYVELYGELLGRRAVLDAGGRIG
jgi:glycosyltransferase involved in cell wall biosynthesis